MTTASPTQGPIQQNLLSGRRRMLAALQLEAVDRPPVWFMRQAGRHLPEYRKLRDRLSFMEICSDPEANKIASLEPWHEYAVDGAIVFNDILTPLRDMGMGLEFSPGPRFDRLIDSAQNVASLQAPQYDDSTDVCRCIKAMRDELGDKAAVLGFIGAPFTVAAFAVAGAGPQRRCSVHDAALSRRQAMDALCQKLLPTLVDYAVAQARAGADVIQVFESLAADATDDLYRAAGLPLLLETVKAIKERLPETPVIIFGRGIRPFVPELAATGASALSLDEARPLSDARRTLDKLGLHTGLQGNLPGDLLRGSPAAATASTNALLDQWRTIVPLPEQADTLGPTGWVFNLGHGVPKDADPMTVRAVADAVRSFDFTTMNPTKQDGES